MSSDAAKAASAGGQQSVVNRETLWEGGVVRINLPSRLKEGDRPIHFLQFAVPVPGTKGLINYFVHTSEKTLNGSIKASVSIKKKTMADGRAYLNVDLVPVPWETKETHKIQVVNGSASKPADLIFAIPPPLCGAIVLTSPEHGGDQLERLLGAGWQIESDQGSEVHLVKMKGTEQKRMVHHRQKKT